MLSTQTRRRPFRRLTVLPRDAKPIAARFDIVNRAARARRGSAALLRAELRLHLKSGTLPPHFDTERFRALCRHAGLDLAAVATLPA